jgi:predicted membrane protein
MDIESTSNAKRNMTGLLFVAFGALLLLNNFNMLPPKIEYIFLSWPMIFVAIGLISLAGKNFTSAAIFFVVGGFFILPRVINFDIRFNQLFWPVIIILVGFSILAHRWNSKKKYVIDEKILGNDQIDEFNLFGGGNRIFQGRVFKGGRITNIFGGSDIDFAGVELGEGTNVLDLTCVFGGAKLIIPSDWCIKNDVVSILGGVSEKTKGPKSENNGKTLIITGKVVFGGAEIVRV